MCGFDIAGPEDGFPPTHHLRAFHLVQREDFHMTIHAGEAFGLPSIWEAVQFCNAERLGHGVRIADDIIEKDGEYHLGRLANFVRDRRIPLEVCPTSNVHTGAAASIATHPIELLRKLRFRVTLNTDNRLMSGISMSSEFETCAETFGWTLNDMEWLTLNAAKSSFYPFDQRLAMINTVIKTRLRRASLRLNAKQFPEVRRYRFDLQCTRATMIGQSRESRRWRRDLNVGLQFRFRSRRSNHDTTGVTESKEQTVSGTESLESVGEVKDFTDREATELCRWRFAH